MGEPVDLEAELDAIPSHEARATVLMELVKRALDAKHAELRKRERELNAAIDALHAAADEADHWFSLFVASASCVQPARERDDMKRAELARRRVA